MALPTAPSIIWRWVRSVIYETRGSDRFVTADHGDAPGAAVTFVRSAGGRVVSVFYLDTTWVHLDRVRG